MVSVKDLTGDWAVFARIAGFFLRRLPPNDREDWLHSTILEMAQVKAKYQRIGKPLTEAGLVKVAVYEFRRYWEKRIRQFYGVSCSSCAREQRQACRTILKSECPRGKAIRVLSLDRLMSCRHGDGGEDDDGPTEFGATVSGKNIDLAAWFDAKRELRCLPKRLVQVGYKHYAGYPLTVSEEACLFHRRTRSKARKGKLRVFVYEGREYPDPNPALTLDEVRRLMADFLPELANAGVRRGYKKDKKIVYELVRLAAVKGNRKGSILNLPHKRHGR